MEARSFEVLLLTLQLFLKHHLDSLFFFLFHPRSSQDLGEHSDMVSYQHIPSMHREPITRVMFEPSTNVIMTSSESNTTSVVFMNVSLKQEPYVWKFKQVINKVSLTDNILIGHFINTFCQHQVGPLL